MRFMMIMYPGPHAERGIEAADQKLFAAMGAYNDELIKAGVLLAAEGLRPTKDGARVRFGGGGKPAVVDGPFTETKEIVGGYWLIQAKSREEAIAWAVRAPCPEGEMIEVRRIWDMEDLGPLMTPELQAQEERQRAAMSKK
jgi:hypothetical protein